MEEYKSGWRQKDGWGPFDVSNTFDEKKNSWFANMFKDVDGFDQFYPRCKMAYNHPDMRQILEM
jgi:hypothetical protein